jgi:hypothetical protein
VDNEKANNSVLMAFLNFNPKEKANSSVLMDFLNINPKEKANSSRLMTFLNINPNEMANSLRLMAIQVCCILHQRRLFFLYCRKTARVKNNSKVSPIKMFR